MPLRLHHRIARPLVRTQPLGAVLRLKQFARLWLGLQQVGDIGPPLALVPVDNQVVDGPVLLRADARPAVAARDVATHLRTPGGGNPCPLILRISPDSLHLPSHYWEEPPFPAKGSGLRIAALSSS